MEEKNVQRPVELSEEQLEKTAGGFMPDVAIGFKTCPNCGLEMPYDGAPGDCACPNCGHNF